MAQGDVSATSEIKGADWVWVDRSGRRNQYAALRLVLDDLRPDQIPDAVPVSVGAGNHYRLYVNGRYLGRGPVLEWAGHAGIDRYDFSRWLAPGLNVISALVHYFGEDVGGCRRTPPGFLLAGKSGDVDLNTGSAAWEAAELDAWNPDAERISIYHGFIEQVDLERWCPAVWKTGAGRAPWQNAVPVPEAKRERACLERRRIPPLAETELPAMKLRARDGNSMLFEAERMLSGILDLELVAGGPLELEIMYGDRLSGGAIEIGENRENTNTSIDRLSVPAGRWRWSGSFALRGFRYVRLAWCGSPPRKARLVPHEIVYPCVNRMVFESSDAWLNRCWEIARLTSRLCMSDTYLDNPSRERQQYGGDGYIQALYGFDLFGDLALWRQFLRHFAQGRRPDGAFQSGGPWCWNQVIPAWTLLWIESVGEYYRHTRERSIAEEYAVPIEAALAWFTPMLGDDGLLTVDECFHWKGGDVLWNFIDWQAEKKQLEGEPARLALNGFYAMALGTAAELLALAGQSDAAVVCAARRKDVAGRLAGHAGLEEHALVSATLAGVFTGRLGPVVRAVGEHQAGTDIMYLFFTLKALVREGHPEAAMRLLRDCFAPMIDAGHGTFWETRKMPAGSSRAICQAIGGAPAYWLPRLVAGIRQISALESEVVLGPLLPAIASARVVLPCIDGEIEIETEGGRVCRVQLPGGWRTRHVD